MSYLSKPLEEAIMEASALSWDQQNLIALEIIERGRSFSRPPSDLTPQEVAQLQAELAAARRGELASDAEVAAMYAKHGL
jgi:hypothetical protein